MLLEGKNALITGAAGGIGRAMTTVFAREGANVWAFARTETEAFSDFCAQTAARYQVWIRPVACDLTDSRQIKAAVKQVMGDKQPLDILINNAGKMGPNRVFQLTPMEDMRGIFDANFFGMIELSQSATRLMARQKKGAVVNVASIAGLDGDAHLDYSAAKAAVVVATKKMARELAGVGIRVNCLCPGLTDTPLVADISEKVESEMLDKILLHRKGRPEEIANVAAFLASDLASYVTGQTWRADGGVM